jgi:hypothetical protein
MNQLSIDFSGRDIGHAKAEEAANHAGQEWQNLAMAARRAYAAKHRQFTIEDVRLAHTDIVAPTDKAWGSIAIRGRNAGLIAACGNVKVQAGRMVATLWQSRLA